MSNLLSIKNIKKKYNTINGEVEAIKDISFDVKEGNLIAIVGSSGCGKSTLLSIISGLDKATNGEIVFGNKDYMMSCACSAGPAFEGGGISCGMRASNGAIEKIKIDKETLKPTLITIGDTKPLGICGSGIIDLICQMILNGIIDRRGKIYRDIDNKRIRFNCQEVSSFVKLEISQMS